MQLPVIDIHCDLLSYLHEVPNATAYDADEIGCTIPDLKQGNVKLQVMAIYTATEIGSTLSAIKQSEIFANLVSNPEGAFKHFSTFGNANDILNQDKISVLASIENAAGICEEDEPLENAFTHLQTISNNVGQVFYIGLTHHAENRFGGGNNTNVGLKNDGKVLLDYLSDKKIALDFSHTSDVLAYDILNHISKNNLNIPIMASHSNYRNVFNHVRNLSDDLAKEIIQQKGLIGINFLRAFMDNENADTIYKHIEHGLNLGGENTICFGADFFHTGSHPDQSRKPFFHDEHNNASRYNTIINKYPTRIDDELKHKICFQNVLNFIERLA